MRGDTESLIGSLTYLSDDIGRFKVGHSLKVLLHGCCVVSFAVEPVTVLLQDLGHLFLVTALGLGEAESR